MNRQPSEALVAFARAELGAEQSSAVLGIAEAIRNTVNRASVGGDTVVGLLFYGSCLRTGETEDKILDFYVLVDGYRTAYASRLMGLANRVLPPNVFYLEWSCQDGPASKSDAAETLRAKYAVVGLDDFVRRASGGGLDLTIWARFSQPSVLVLAKDTGIERAIAVAVAGAALTTLAETLPMMHAGDKSREMWAGAFLLTYSAELRSETGDKGNELYTLDQARYDALTPLVLDNLGVRFDGNLVGEIALAEEPDPRVCRKAKWRWMRRRVNGKILSVLRLLKASVTFDGGIDYLAWKISRHSGVQVEIKPWQRRHPILAGLVLFWTLRRRGAFR